MKKTLFILAIALCGTLTLFAQKPMKGFVSGGAIVDGIDASFGMPIAGMVDGTKHTLDLPFSHLVQKDIEATVMNGENYDDGYFKFTPAMYYNAGEHYAYFIQKDPRKLDVAATLDLTVIKCGLQVFAKEETEEYPTVWVTGHCWTKENMRENPAAEYADKAFPYDNDDNNTETYGLLSTWNAAMSTPETEGSTTTGDNANNFTQGVCPEGWHIPTLAEMADLRTNSAFDLNATILWQGTMASQNTNTTGFTALPAGMFNDVLNRFEGLGTQTDWWTDNGGNASETTVTVTEINYYCNTPEEKQMNVQNAISVRCVKDNPLAEPRCHEPQLVPAGEVFPGETEEDVIDCPGVELGE